MKSTTLPSCLLAMLLAVACSHEQSSADGSPTTVPPVTPPAPSAQMASKICTVVKAFASRPRTAMPMLAQAQFVSAVAQEFDNDPQSLQQVSETIDTVALQACAAERAAILSEVQKESLAETVR